MSGWKFELNLKDVWKKAGKETEETWMIPLWFVDLLITRMENLLKQMQVKFPTGLKEHDFCEELQSLIEQINLIKTNEGIPKDDFDPIWTKIYDWADSPVSNKGDHLCWISTNV